MEGNLRDDLSPPAPDHSGGTGEGCGSGGTRNRTSPASSSVTLDDSKHGGLFQNEDEMPDQYTEWTDEKHSSYLNFLEASFVEQLQHRSMGLLAWCSQKKSRDPKSYKQKPANTLSSPHQFTVLRDGCWQTANLQRSHSRPDTISDSHAIQGSPWIRHFTSVRKSSGVELPDQEQQEQCSCEINHQNGKSYGVATGSNKSPVCHLSQQAMVGSIREVSDQNFIDEDEKEDSGSVPAPKRSRIAAADALRKDQVVPLSGKEDTSVCPESDDNFYLNGS